jgi:isocitrate dehydrogenase
VGKNDDGTLIKEFEASHGTVSDLWKDHLAGRETSLNPLGLVEAMIGAMQHAATLQVERTNNSVEAINVKDKVDTFCITLRKAIHNTFRYGQGTRDMAGPSGFTTEDFVAKVAWRLQRYLAVQEEDYPPPKLSEPDRKFRRNHDVDQEALNAIFQKYDVDKDGVIDFNEFSLMMDKMGLAPKRKHKEQQRKSKQLTSMTDPDAKQPDV